MKKFIVMMLIMLLIMFSTVPIYSEYQPLTDTEAEAWLRSISIDQLITFVQIYDYIEKAPAQVFLPPATYMLVDNDLYISYKQSVRIHIAHLRYEFEIEDEIIENFQEDKKQEYKRQKTITGVVAGIISFFAGGLVVALISK